MPATYNIDFLFAALVIILMVGIHFVRDNRRSNDIKSLMFMLVLVIGTTDIVLEILTCTVCVTYATVIPIWLNYAMNIGFWLGQGIVPFLFFAYSGILSKRYTHVSRTLRALTALPLLAYSLTVLSTPLTGLIFAIDPATGAYISSSTSIIGYIHAAFYGIAAVSVAFRHRRAIRRIDFAAICEFMGILVTCVILQNVLHIQLTGLGIGAGILVFFISINNPFVIIDALTGLLESTRFRAHINNLIKANRHFEVVFVSLDYLRTLSPLISSELVDEAVVRSANAFLRSTRKRPAFRAKPTVLAVATFSKHERNRVLREMQEFFDQPHMVNGTSMLLNVTTGFIPNHEQLASSDEFFEYMEYILDLIKSSSQSGQASTATNHDELIAQFQRKKNVRHYIEDALRNDLFTISLQPIYSIERQSFDSAEALTRLHHPTAGFVSPSEFIPQAEEDGRISELSRSQFRKLCELWETQGAKLESLGIKSIKVNVSAIELLEPDLGDFLLDTMAAHGVAPERFEFEITETAATTHSAELLLLAERLRSAGSKLAMDDFGSGYANFTGILELPFDTIKLDIALLHKAAEDERGRTMLQHIVSMLNSLGYHLVSEGIETLEQAQMVKSWGVHGLQGFWLARPLSVDYLIEMTELEAPKALTQGSPHEATNSVAQGAAHAVAQDPATNAQGATYGSAVDVGTD